MATGMQRGQRFLLLATIVLLALAVWITWPLRAAVVFALLIGYMLQKPQAWLVRLVKKGWIAAGILTLLLLVALLAPVAWLVFRLVHEADRIAGSAMTGTELRNSAEAQLIEWGLSESAATTVVAEVTTQLVDFMRGLASSIVSGLGAVGIGLLLFTILLYLIIKDGKRIGGFLHHNLPLDPERANQLMLRSGEYLEAILLGVFAVSVIQGVLATVGWWLLGLPNPIFWGFVMLIASIIPIIGAFVVLLPAAGWAFATGQIWTGVGLLVLNFVMVGLVDDLLRPVLIGGRANVHPGLVLVGILGGAATMGVAGIILGPLVFALIVPIFEEWVHPEDEPLANAGPNGADEAEDG